ncbi:MAG: glycosyltransferase family 4 protein [Opitutales bacterium]|nr:glycosyltransferase family 4 protein [Opitutales bacterium]
MNRLPRILIWSWKRQGGGLRCGLELARALANRTDCETRVCTLAGNAYSEEFRKTGLVDEFPVDCAQPWKVALAMLGLRSRFASLLDSYKPDIVISPMECVWNTFASGLFAQRGIAYAGIVHEPRLRKGNEMIKGIAGRLASSLSERLYECDLARLELCITLSHHSAAILTESGIPKERIMVHTHPVFRSDVPPKNSVNNPVRLLFFGRIVPSKGLGLLTESYATLRRLLPAVTLRICGRCNGVDPVMLEQAGIQVDNRFVPEDEVPALMRWADIILLPYTNASQSGVAAMATGAGLPSVATPAGGLPEQIADGVNGRVASGFMAAEFADAVKSLVEDPALYARTCAGARKAAQGDLSWDHFAGELIGRLWTERQKSC